MSCSGCGRWRTTRDGGRFAVAVGLMLLALLRAESAHAELGQDEVSAGAKGTVGLTLLGAEAVLTLEAAFGVRKPWLYAIGGGAGAVAGLIGGRYVDKAGNAQLSMSLLITGLLLAVPTTIAVLNASAYSPPHNPVIDDGSATSSFMSSNLPMARGMLATSLVGIDSHGTMELKMPSIEVTPVFSKTTRQIHSLPSATAFEVPVFSLTFY